MIKEGASKSQGNELGALWFLLHYLQLNKKGLLIKNGKPATVADIAKIIGKSETTTQRIIKKLSTQGFIIGQGSTRNKTYSISEKYFIMGDFEAGKRMYSRLYQMESRGKLKKITIEDANILLRILPCFHTQQYYLCSNPYDADGDINHLNETELADIIGIERTTLSRHIGRLIRAGYIIKIVGMGNSYLFQVNPDVMKREKDHDSAEARMLRGKFAELAKKNQRDEIAKELGLS